MKHGDSAPWAQGVARMLRLRGALASVALSHDEGCDCTTCAAAHGDAEAFERIYREMEANRAR